ncbi:MAG: LamG-like jellyroll fold domain-containing protein [Ignavibacteria bacterium]
MNKLFYLLLPLLFIVIQSTNAQYYYNRAYSFSGATGTYAATDPGTNLSITGSFTVECWVMPTNVASPSYQIIIQKRLGSAASGYTMYLSTGKVSIRTNSSTRLTGTTVIPNGAWSHIAATYNSTSGVFTVYVNGVADGTITVSGAAPAADTDSLRFAAGFNSPYAGLMDEIRVWNVERVQSDIQSTMRMPLGNGDATGPYAGLVGAWRGNSITAGSGIEEISGYTAHMNGAATFVATGNTPQGYLAFNTGLMCTGAATGTCVSIPTSTLVNPINAITLECWVYTTNTAIQVIIGKGSSGYPYRLIKTYSNNTFGVLINGTFVGTPNVLGGIIPTGKWTHLAFTYVASSGAFAYYMNGAQTASGTQSQGTLTASSSDMAIGGGPSQVTYSGMIDEVRISDYAKTQDQVIKGMFTSIDATNDPNPSGNTAVFSFEGTLKDYDDGANPGVFTGTVGGIRFTQVYNNGTEFPTPLDRWDAGSFANGYRVKFSDLTFGASPTSIIDSIYMPQGLTISDINVFVGITHTYANDISVSLRNPANTTTRILTPGAGSNVGMHMITVFDDQADSTIGGTVLAPFSPRIKPVNNLAIFNGQTSTGWWKLLITDIFPASDDGRLVGWGIQFNDQTVVSVSSPTESNIPERFALHQNYPNPFNPVTTIKYDIAKSTNVKMTVYDILGREVMVPVNEFKKAGYYSIIISGSGLASGVYFYKIEAGNFTETHKMILVK